MKKYPFSIVKHAHDIEYRYNRLKNIEWDYFVGGTQLTDEEYTRLQEELELVTKAYHTILATPSDGKIVWVDGETYGILKKCVMWATEERYHKNRK